MNNSNQSGLFFYPVSDTVLVSVHKEFDGYYLLQYTGVRNKHNEIIKVFGQQWSPSGYLSFIAWREDSLIIGAKEVLESGRVSDALSAFRRAYNLHPEHFYLANYIQHLELVESPEYESLKSAFNDLAGE